MPGMMGGRPGMGGGYAGMMGGRGGMGGPPGMPGMPPGMPGMMGRPGAGNLPAAGTPRDITIRTVMTTSLQGRH
jgi:hypothetical protein